MPAHAPDLSPKRPRLLLVEDDLEICALLAEALSIPYEVEAVGDGLAGWYAAQRRPPALVIIGLSVSRTDLLVLTRALRANPRTATMPIILLTGSADRELLLSCLAAGADHFLLKPFAVDELLECARLELLRPSHLHQRHGSSPNAA